MGDNEAIDIGMLLSQAKLARRINDVEYTNALLKEALKLAQRALNIAPNFRVGDTTSYRIASQVDTALTMSDLSNFSASKEDTRETVPVPVPSGHNRFGVIYQPDLSRASRIKHFRVEDASAKGLTFQDCLVMSQVIAEALNSQAKSGLFGGARTEKKQVEVLVTSGEAKDWSCL